MSLKVVFCAVLLSAVQGITFYAKEGVEKCFSDEIPSRTIVIVYHQLKSEGVSKNDKRSQDKMLQDGIKVNVYDPKGELVKTQLASKDSPKISFTASSMGRYKFCVYKPKQFWNVYEFKFYLKIQQGVDFNLPDAANKDHVKSLKERIDALKNRTEDFLNLQQLNREQEDRLTTQSITINQRVTQTTVLQIVVLILSGTYQIWSLRKFFKTRFLM